MVLGVCQRVLNHAQDAEDAFQATFLVLVRKAGSLARPELLANWLYRVAYRTAKKARAHASRHHGCAGLADCILAEPGVDAAGEELRATLDEELQRLPDKYRVPLILCYLEGKTNEEAARQLGWPTGSMSCRLARGRELLRERLTSRNRALPAGPFALVLTRQAGAVTKPARRADATVQAALLAVSAVTFSAGLLAYGVRVSGTACAYQEFPRSVSASRTAPSAGSVTRPTGSAWHPRPARQSSTRRR
jgi:RNA polymerase sigma factor (sigma-70 family)